MRVRIRIFFCGDAVIYRRTFQVMDSKNSKTQGCTPGARHCSVPERLVGEEDQNVTTAGVNFISLQGKKSPITCKIHHGMFLQQL